MARQPGSEVLVVGAGPVGLFAALTLRERGVDVAVVDQSQRTSQHSYALAIHPRTLGLLDEVGLAEPLIQRGRPLERVAFYEGAQRKAEIDLSRLEGKFPFVLLLRQSELERGLEEELRERKVKVLWNHRLQSLTHGADRAVAHVAELDQVATGYPIQRADWVVARSIEWRASFVIGADGYDSAVRRMSGIGMTDLHGGIVASVFEIEASGELPNEARVILQPGQTSVYWPLELGRCRLGFQIASAAEHDVRVERLRALLAGRAPWFGAVPKDIYWSTVAVFDRRLAERFGEGTTWLAGDAAHLTTPVGVHSLNAGLHEARSLAEKVASVLKRGASRTVLAEYDAAARAEWRVLLADGDALRALPEADPWVRDNKDRILASTPASGEDLPAVLRQIGLEAVPPA